MSDANLFEIQYSEFKIRIFKSLQLSKYKKQTQPKKPIL